MRTQTQSTSVVIGQKKVSIEAVPGMVTLTTSGQGHSLKNTGDETLAFIALIILD